MHGTNSEKCSESDYIDRYIKKTCVENSDYEIISAETWEFLTQRYAFDFEVKRYYQKGTWSYNTSLEVNLKLVPVVLVFTDQLLNQPIEPSDYQTRYIQVRKTCTYTDLKKRIADVVSHIK